MVEILGGRNCRWQGSIRIARKIVTETFLEKASVLFGIDSQLIKGVEKTPERLPRLIKVLCRCSIPG